jgi:hypothetical protein
MAEQQILYVETDGIQRMLDDGWTVAGYSTVLMAAGAMTHSILLKKGNELVTVNISTVPGWGTTTKTIVGFLSYSPKT